MIINFSTHYEGDFYEETTKIDNGWVLHLKIKEYGFMPWIDPKVTAEINGQLFTFKTPLFHYQNNFSVRLNDRVVTAKTVFPGNSFKAIDSKTKTEISAQSRYNIWGSVVSDAPRLYINGYLVKYSIMQISTKEDNSPRESSITLVGNMAGLNLGRFSQNLQYEFQIAGQINNEPMIDQLMKVLIFGTLLKMNNSASLLKALKTVPITGIGVKTET